MSTSFRITLFAFSFILVLACAHMEAPSGGPEDKIPPWITGTFPGQKSVNNSRKLIAAAEFSEWINENLAPDAISISPPLEKALHISVSGKRIDIETDSPLDSATTYSLVFSTKISDLHGNSLLKPFSLVFSTGKAIDTLKLSGQIFSAFSEKTQKIQNYTTALYPIGPIRKSLSYLKKILADSTLKNVDSIPYIIQEKPLYTTSADSNGHFTFSGLRPGKYRILAFSDKNGNRKPDPGIVSIAMAQSDLQVPYTQDSLQLFTGVPDTSKLMLLSAEVLPKNYLLLKFNKKPTAIDSGLNAHFDSSHFHIQKLSDSSSISISHLIWPSTLDEMPILSVNNADADSSYVVICKNLKSQNGDLLDSTRSQAVFTWRNFPENVPNSIVKTTPKNGMKMVSPTTPIQLYFNIPPQIELWNNQLLLEAEGDTLLFSLNRIGPNVLNITPKKELPNNARVQLFQIYLDTVFHRDSTNKTDTIVTPKKKGLLTFNTIETLKMASLSGNILHANQSTQVRLLQIESHTVFNTQCSPQGNFEFSNLSKGNYLMEYWNDLDNNYIQSHGSMIPWKFPEPSFRISDTLHISAGNNLLSDQLKKPLSISSSTHMSQP